MIQCQRQHVAGEVAGGADDIVGGRHRYAALGRIFVDHAEVLEMRITVANQYGQRDLVEQLRQCRRPMLHRAVKIEHLGNLFVAQAVLRFRIESYQDGDVLEPDWRACLRAIEPPHDETLTVL